MTKTIDIALEASLLNVMSYRQNYEKYIQYIDLKRVLPNTSLLLKDYKKYFNMYPNNERIQLGDFYTHFSQTWHQGDLEKHDLDYYQEYVFPAIEKVENADIEATILSLIQKRYVKEIEKSVHDNLDVLKIRDILNTYETSIGHVTNQQSAAKTVFDLDFNKLNKEDGIEWCLPSLQNALMSITVGQFILLSGDTNSGKSSLLRQQVAHTIRFLKNKGDNRKILHLNSEGCLEDAAAGVFSALFKEEIEGGFEEIVQNSEAVIEKFKTTYKEHADNYILLPMYEIGSIYKLEQELKIHNPAIIFIDITDALAKEEDAKTLKKVYDDLRILAGQFCPIVATTQAGNQEYFDKVENKFKKIKWLTDKALYGSKQKGSAADSMVMIGQDDQDSNIRYVSTTKRKRGQDVKIICKLYGKYSYFEELVY